MNTESNPAARFTVDALAQEIRRVDGTHSLSAGALAEALLPFIVSVAPTSAGNRGEWVMVPRHELTELRTFLSRRTAMGWADRLTAWLNRTAPAPPPSNGCAVIVPRDVMEAAERMAVPLADGRPTLTDKLDEQCSQRILSFLRSLAAAPQPSAPGPDDVAAAKRDAFYVGTGFLVDGKHVASHRITMVKADEEGTISAAPQPSAPSAPEAGIWRCEVCGDMKDDLSPAWRWNGEAWEHKHGQGGHFVARYFGTTQEAGKIDEAMVERALFAYAASRGTYAGESLPQREDMRAALEAAGLGGGGGDGIPDMFSAYRTWPQDIRAKLSLHDLRRMAGWAPRTSVADWRIDTSAGGPILVYQDCSVIEGEQARYILGLIHADTNRAAQPSESEAGGQEGECPHEAWEENGGARRCSDCREYLGHAPAPAEGGR